jgi:hypothetical protein
MVRKSTALALLTLAPFAFAAQDAAQPLAAAQSTTAATQQAQSAILPVFGIDMNFDPSWVDGSDVPSKSTQYSHNGVNDAFQKAWDKLKSAGFTTMRFKVDLHDSQTAARLANLCIWAKANNAILIPVLDSAAGTDTLAALPPALISKLRAGDGQQAAAYSQLGYIQVGSSINAVARKNKSADGQKKFLNAVDALRNAEAQALQGTGISPSPLMASVSFDYELILQGAAAGGALDPAAEQKALASLKHFLEPLAASANVDAINVEWLPRSISAGDADRLAPVLHDIQTAVAAKQLTLSTGFSTAFNPADQQTQFLTQATANLWNLRVSDGGASSHFTGVIFAQAFNDPQADAAQAKAIDPSGWNWKDKAPQLAQLMAGAKSSDELKWWLAKVRSNTSLLAQQTDASGTLDFAALTGLQTFQQISAAVAQASQQLAPSAAASSSSVGAPMNLNAVSAPAPQGSQSLALPAGTANSFSQPATQGTATKGPSVYQQLLAPLVQQATAQLTTALVTRVSTLGQGKPPAQFPGGSGNPDPSVMAQSNPGLAPQTQASPFAAQGSYAAPLPSPDSSPALSSSTYVPPATVLPQSPGTNQFPSVSQPPAVTLSTDLSVGLSNASASPIATPAQVAAIVPSQGAPVTQNASSISATSPPAVSTSAQPTIASAAPAISMSAQDVTVDNASVTPGQAVRITAQLHNFGATDAKGLTVRLVDPANTAASRRTQRHVTVPQSGSAQVQFTWTAGQSAATALRLSIQVVDPTGAQLASATVPSITVTNPSVAAVPAVPAVPAIAVATPSPTPAVLISAKQATPQTVQTPIVANSGIDQRSGLATPPKPTPASTTDRPSVPTGSNASKTAAVSPTASVTVPLASATPSPAVAVQANTVPVRPGPGGFNKAPLVSNGSANAAPTASPLASASPVPAVRALQAATPQPVPARSPVATTLPLTSPSPVQPGIRSIQQPASAKATPTVLPATNQIVRPGPGMQTAPAPVSGAAQPATNALVRPGPQTQVSQNMAATPAPKIQVPQNVATTPAPLAVNNPLARPGPAAPIAPAVQPKTVAPPVAPRPVNAATAPAAGQPDLSVAPADVHVTPGTGGQLSVSAVIRNVGAQNALGASVTFKVMAAGRQIAASPAIGFSVAAKGAYQASWSAQVPAGQSLQLSVMVTAPGDVNAANNQAAVAFSTPPVTAARH